MGSSKRMSSGQAYFALLKAYCAINVLLLPKSFRNGGYVLSPIALITSCFFECTCAIKLSQCALTPEMSQFRSLTYTDIVSVALGTRFLRPFKIIIALVQFQFTISQLAFVIESMRSTIAEFLHHDDQVNEENQQNAKADELYVWIALAVLVVFAPLTWVRQI